MWDSFMDTSIHYRKSQLSQQEIKATRHLARVRIHVEEIIGHLRKQDIIIKRSIPIIAL